ncbi:hypothetical protein [Niabella ginsengisoli]|uniref:Uncharacterized protein n=1 Tax=Niabella ginsengisoli TaxID=522298 RepID=A0ABS9SHV0_9BACT|nr:hypothetical protein [Niabella ginsengisoli]MCH5597946.1 hypothetical protein [Niabella ginsengisoli]
MQDKPHTLPALDAMLLKTLREGQRLTWLELLITCRLNPAKHAINNLKQTELQLIHASLKQELFSLKIDTHQSIF